MAENRKAPSWLIAVLLVFAVFAVVQHGTYAPVPEVTVSEAAKLIAEKKARVIDVRDDAAYREGHIAGATSVPLPDLGPRADALGLPKTDPIIVYDADGVARGPDATRLLRDLGYSGAVNLKGGIEAWGAAGQALVK